MREKEQKKVIKVVKKEIVNIKREFWRAKQKGDCKNQNGVLKGKTDGQLGRGKQNCSDQDVFKWFSFNDIFLNPFIVYLIRCQALPTIPNYISLTEFTWIICNICNSIAVVLSFTRTRYHTCIPWPTFMPSGVFLSNVIQTSVYWWTLSGIVHQSLGWQEHSLVVEGDEKTVLSWVKSCVQYWMRWS